MDNSEIQIEQQLEPQLDSQQSCILAPQPSQKTSNQANLNLIFKIKNKHKQIFKLIKRSSTTIKQNPKKKANPPHSPQIIPPPAIIKKKTTYFPQSALTSAAIAALTQQHHLHFLQENNLTNFLNIPSFQLNPQDHQLDESINGNPSQNNDLEDEELFSVQGFSVDKQNTSLFPSTLPPYQPVQLNQEKLIKTQKLSQNLSKLLKSSKQYPQISQLQQQQLSSQQSNTITPLSYDNVDPKLDMFLDEQPTEIELSHEMISSDNSKCKIFDSQRGEQYNRREKSLEELSKKFLTIFLQRDEMMISLDKITQQLDVERRRIYDIINILESLKLVTRRGKNNYKWNGFNLIFQTIADLSNNEQYQHQDIEDACEINEKKEKSLEILSIGFLKLFLSYKETLSLEEAARKLSPINCEQQKIKTKIRRLYDIANVFKSLGLIKKVQLNKTNKPAFQWVGVSGLQEFENSSKENQIGVNSLSLNVSHDQINDAQQVQMKNKQTEKDSKCQLAASIVGNTQIFQGTEGNNNRNINVFPIANLTNVSGSLNRSNNSAFKAVNRSINNRNIGSVIPSNTNQSVSIENSRNNGSFQDNGRIDLDKINLLLEQNIIINKTEKGVENNLEQKIDDNIDPGLAARCINLLLKLFKGEQGENIESNCDNENKSIQERKNIDGEVIKGEEDKIELLKLVSVGNSPQSKQPNTPNIKSFASSINSAFQKNSKFQKFVQAEIQETIATINESKEILKSTEQSSLLEDKTNEQAPELIIDKQECQKTTLNDTNNLFQMCKDIEDIQQDLPSKLVKDISQDDISRKISITEETPIEISQTQKKEQISPSSSGCLSPSNCKNTNIFSSDFKNHIQLRDQGSVTTSASCSNQSSSSKGAQPERQQILAGQIPQQQQQFQRQLIFDDEILPSA